MDELLSSLEMAKGVADGRGGAGRGNKNVVIPSDRVLDEQPKTLAQIGVSKNQSSKAQKLAKVPKEEFEKELNENTKPISSAILKKVHVANNSNDNEWYTPPKYQSLVRSVLGCIDIDPASCETANINVRADRFCSLTDDGLSKFLQINSFLRVSRVMPRQNRVVQEWRQSPNR